MWQWRWRCFHLLFIVMLREVVCMKSSTHNDAYSRWDPCLLGRKTHLRVWHVHTCLCCLSLPHGHRCVCESEQFLWKEPTQSLTYHTLEAWASFGRWTVSWEFLFIACSRPFLYQVPQVLAGRFFCRVPLVLAQETFTDADPEVPAHHSPILFFPKHFVARNDYFLI